MSTNKTQNLQLHSWVADDPVKMSEFNENFEAIDSLLTRIAVGSYVGTGTCGSENPNALTFDFAPKFLLIWQDGYVTSLGLRGGKLRSISTNSYGTCNATWEGNTVSWSHNSDASWQMNANRSAYYYVALG